MYPLPTPPLPAPSRRERQIADPGPSGIARLATAALAVLALGAAMEIASDGDGVAIERALAQASLPGPSKE